MFSMQKSMQVFDIPFQYISGVPAFGLPAGFPLDLEDMVSVSTKSDGACASSTSLYEELAFLADVSSKRTVVFDSPRGEVAVRLDRR
jgi:hypothetical protein